MAKSVQSILLRWDADFVEEIRVVAGPRGMSGFIRRAVEAAMNTPASQQTVANYKHMTGQTTERQIIAGLPIPAPKLDALGHEFKAGKSPFVCECGKKLAEHKPTWQA